MPLLSTAYAGTADINEENLDALLNQILPDGPLGMIYIPDEIPRRAFPGLTKVVGWLEREVGKEGTIPVKNLVEALLERNSKLAAEGEDEDELVLVMVYNPASGLDNNLVKEAHAAGIKVLDLAAAGDEIVPEEPEPPADEQPPFEPDEPKQEEKAPAQEESPVGKAVRRATSAGKAAATRQPAPEPPPAAAPPAAPSTGVQISINLPPEVLDALATALAPRLVAAMGAQAQAVVATAPAEPALASVTPIGTAGGNPADPAGQPEGTAVYYYNEEKGTYRPARGTKRKGEERVFLTPDEVAEAKTKGMLG